MYVKETLRNAALKIRNAARQEAEASPAGSRRRVRAMDLVEKIEPKMFGSIAYVDLPASKGTAVYSVDLLDDGTCSCDCPDAQRGNLCKHRIALAASVIRFAAKNGCVVEEIENDYYDAAQGAAAIAPNEQGIRY